MQGTPEELAAIEHELSSLTGVRGPRLLALLNLMGCRCRNTGVPGRTAQQRGMLTLEHLRVEVGDGEIDTVVLAFTDMQGRLQGKRLAAEFFLDEVAEHYSEGCNYLLAVDVEMNTVDGYAMSSWDRGYGDFVLRAGHGHAAPGPVARGHGHGHRRPDLAGRRAGAWPRRGRYSRPRRSGWPSAGWTAMVGTELEFVVYNDSYEQAAAKGYRDLVPANQYNVDYSILGTSRIEPLLRRIRNEMAGRGPVRRVGQGRVQPRPARDRVPLRRGRHHLRQPLDLQDRRQGDRGPGRRPASRSWPSRTRARATPATSTCRSGGRTARPVLAGDGPYGLSKLGEHFLAGQLAAMRELTLCYAPNINSYKRYVPGSFAPTSVRWGPDNRTCALRLVGHGASLRVENRVPGGDVNPYLAVAAMIAAGLHGIDNELPLEPAVEGNAYLDTSAKVPHTLRDALELWQKSDLAREAFGAEVVEHYANYARVELEAYDAAVTDWELRRGFERL